jgi:Ca2+-binding EF-hand superfamily protein
MAHLTASQEQELRDAFNLFDTGMIPKKIEEKLNSIFRSFG